MPLGRFGLLCSFLETRIQRNPFEKLSSVTQKKIRLWSRGSEAAGLEELLVSRCFDFSAVLCRNWENTTNLIIQVIRASTETAFGNDFKNSTPCTSISFSNTVYLQYIWITIVLSLMFSSALMPFPLPFPVHSWYLTSF